MSEQEARSALHNAGYKDVTAEANAQNKRTDYAVFIDPSGEGVHYCFEEEDVIELAEVAQSKELYVSRETLQRALPLAIKEMRA